MKICITRTEKHAYSETFIRDQIKEFKSLCETYTIHSGRYPERMENGSLLNPYLFWVFHKMIKILVGRNNYFSDYGVKKYLNKNKIDVVLANYGMSASHMVAPCKALNIPLIVIFHGHDATDKKLLNEYKHKYVKLFDYASNIIVVSNDMKSQLIGLGAPKSKIQIIPCGVNTSMFESNTEPAQQKTFLAVGRLTAKKGPLYTIKAFNSVLQKHPDSKLIFVGNKNGLYNECQDLISNLGIGKSVTFTGILSQKEISILMKSSLAFVQHSITAPNGDMEGSPVSIMEAASSGLPIVSTKHAGIKELVVHDKTGFLVDEKDVNKMAEYMIELCDNFQLAKSMGMAGRNHMEQHYEQKRQIGKLYDLAKDIVSSKK
ncbi:glycosyltransferase family 4 protein [Allomuricauda sp. XS_ASV26]|uniref:glycosyltransferase family 4 protein n=1 Tax=Allomuricauda sp. XS_ASV26 TaxID=3241292 RepID=UPI0035166882